MLISIGDKVELKDDGEIYIVERKCRDQLTIRKYYKSTMEIDVTVSDILILPNIPNVSFQEKPDDAIEVDDPEAPTREIESTSQFSKFLKKFFKIPSNILYDPWYFCLIPNMTVLLIWLTLSSLICMSCLTVLFCLCSLVLDNPFWLTFSQLFVFYLGLSLSSFGLGAMRYARGIRLRMAFVFWIFFQITVISSVSVWLKSLVPSGWPALILSFCLWGAFTSLVRSILYVYGELSAWLSFENNPTVVARDMKLVWIFTRLTLASQLFLIQFWIWGPPEIIHILGDYMGSFLILLLLKISKHGYIKMNCIAFSWVQWNVFYARSQLRCLLYASFAEVLVLSHATVEQYVSIVSMRFLFDLCETLYLGKALNNQRDPIRKMLGYENSPKALDTLINWSSSYIRETETIEVIVPLYFCIAIFILLSFGQNDMLYVLGAHTMDTFISSFVWSMLVLIVMKAVNGVLLRQLLSLNNTSMAQNGIYLMENQFKALFIAPLIVVSFFLITCQSFSDADSI